MKILLVTVMAAAALTGCQSTVQSFKNNLSGVYAPEFKISEEKSFKDSYTLHFPKLDDATAYENINFIFTRHDSVRGAYLSDGYHNITTSIPGKNWDRAATFNLYDMKWLGTRGELTLTPNSLVMKREYCQFSAPHYDKCMSNSGNDGRYTLSSKTMISQKNDHTELKISNISLDIKQDKSGMELKPEELIKYVNNFRYKVSFKSEYPAQSTMSAIKRISNHSPNSLGAIANIAGQEFVYSYNATPYKHGSLATFYVSIPAKINGTEMDFNYATNDINTYFKKVVSQD